MKYIRPLHFAFAAALFAHSTADAPNVNAEDRYAQKHIANSTKVISQNYSSSQAIVGSVRDVFDESFNSLAASDWTADDIATWAAKNSPTANLLEAERAALGQSLDCKDEEQKAQIGLIQAVSRELALHSRQEAAADALDVYFQAQATVMQMKILRQAAPPLDSLESLAAKAENLELPDGDIDELADRRMEMEDRWFQADLGLQRLRNQLAGIVGRDHVVAEAAILSSPFPTDVSIELSAEAHIPEALSFRRDLKAIETLCRCTNSKTLPAAKQLLGALVPGIGLQVGDSGGGCGLLGIHRNADDDLGCRKAQCQQIASARRDQIEAQVRDAVLQLREASSRLEVARRRAALRSDMAERSARAIQLEQKPPGTDQLAELESLEQQAEVVARELAVARAIVALNRAKGTTVRQ